MNMRKNSTDLKNISNYPLLALPKVVVMPMIPQPVKIDDEEDIKFLENIIASHHEIAFATLVQDEGSQDDKSILPEVNICAVDRIFQLPGAPTLAFVRPLAVASIKEFDLQSEIPSVSVVKKKPVLPPKRETQEQKYLLERIRELRTALMDFMPDQERENAEKLIADNSSTRVSYLYAVAHTAPLSWEEKYSLLKCKSYINLLDTVTYVLDISEQRISLQASIHQRTHMEISQQQKEAFLRLHMKHIQEELGENDDDQDINELKKRALEKKWNEKTKQHFEKELQKLQRLNINNPEYSVQYSYLETFLELPWENYKDVKVDLNKVREVLDRDHYGLEKVKQRILEYMAVVKLRKDLKAPIICLYGPPGVGKTSIGKSVAEASNREYARISLGGMHDESEIRGHRRTYIGAMPGRFLQSLTKLQYGNPLILLDEIDKVGKDFKGDPSSALLEALDPEQNNTFHDNFVDAPYDLSKVMFIATANDISSIPAPLRDRMEVIEMPKYTHDEKREIAFRHLISQVLEDNGFSPEEISFTPEAIDTVIKSFTKEAGVRQLKMQLSKIIRKLALLKAKDEKFPKEITEKLVSEYLDKKDIHHNQLGFKG